MSAMQTSSIDVIASTLGSVVPDLGAMSSPDGALTLLFTDVEDAHALAERLGEPRWSELLRDHRAMVEQVVTHHDGKVVKAKGDGYMAAFQSSHAGLNAAIDIQRTFAQDPALKVRAGVHSGFVIVNGEDYLGRNVVLGARIADRARGGEILVSAALKEFVASDPAYRFEERGEFHFKGVLGEHMVYGVDWTDAGAAA
jgi:class 3 adenylate cyclase